MLISAVSFLRMQTSQFCHSTNLCLILCAGIQPQSTRRQTGPFGFLIAFFWSSKVKFCMTYTAATCVRLLRTITDHYMCDCFNECPTTRTYVASEFNKFVTYTCRKSNDILVRLLRHSVDWLQTNISPKRAWIYAQACSNDITFSCLTNYRVYVIESLFLVTSLIRSGKCTCNSFWVIDESAV